MIRSKDGDHGTFGISEYLTEQGSYREHDGGSQSCRVVELTSYREHVLLGDGTSGSSRKAKSKSSLEGMLRNFLCRLSLNLREYLSLKRSQVIPRYLLAPSSLEHYHSLMKNPPLHRKEEILVWSTIEPSLESASTPPSSRKMSSRTACLMASCRWMGDSSMKAKIVAAVA